MMVRVGIEGGRRPVLVKAKEIGAPILVSANSLWNNSKKCFSGWQCYLSHDVALDCGGFVAMKRYGGYRWTVDQYVALAREMRPTWWAQMDLCCEPELAADRSAVYERIDRTASLLGECRDAAQRNGMAMPLPVLQGWNPEDYCQGPIYDAGFDWPELVGIGSVCRRNVFGHDGIIAVLDAVTKAVPDHVKFHLFGVKSSAIEKVALRFQGRVASTDSMAWAYAARMEAVKSGVPCTGELRAYHMGRWYLVQVTPHPKPDYTQLSLCI